MSEIRYYNAENQTLETEKVMGERAIRGLYRFPAKSILSFSWIQHFISKCMGCYYSSPLSKKHIQPFVQNHGVNMALFEDVSHSSFNDFFIRKFKAGVRPFPSDEKTMGAFAEGRYYAFKNIRQDLKLPIKGCHIVLDELLKGLKKYKMDATGFVGGSLVIARLCPSDYHRFHFPASGKVRLRFRTHGPLDSVSPLALKAKGDILFKNERQVTIAELDGFGPMAMIEVGAMGVGTIVQTHQALDFYKGDEKGYFLFGGSTVIALFADPKVNLDPQILERTDQGLETLLPLGHPLANVR